MAYASLATQVRSSKGKGAARKLRRDNKIPAIFYGPNAEPMMLTVDYTELEGILRQPAGENILLDLNVSTASGTETKKAMLKELVVDPVKDTYLHADFYEISLDKEITVNVPIQLINTPVGVTNGGILEHIRRELAISCLPDNIVDAFDLDVSGLDIGDSLHVRDIELPEGVKTAEEAHLTIAVVAAPTVEPVEEEEELEAEAAEEEAAEEEASAEES